MIISPTKAGLIEKSAATVVTLDGVSKRYPLAKSIDRAKRDDFADFWALRDISFQVSAGEILGIIGRNGAGKTTLLNIIAGVLSPAEGALRVNGRVLGLFNLGVGFQDELSGRENIFLNGAILGASREYLKNKSAQIIDFSELGEFIDMPLGSYSQGMRLRLAFSVIANMEFDILVIDEILAVGDGPFQSKCFERLMDFKRAGKTLIITTQGLDLIERLCGRVALLDHGRLSFYGDTIEGVNRYRLLLNTHKFSVGPGENNRDLVENTKKWADDISQWGKKLGTKEARIDSVEFINSRGSACVEIKSGEPLKIKVCFTAKDDIKEPHLGVAIFRSDGVYCYGPNTLFDGQYISILRKGPGYFVLQYDKILLAPSEYRLSVAIWDKNEALAFDYHDGCYKLKVAGRENKYRELLDVPFETGMRRRDGSFLKKIFGARRSIELAGIKALDSAGRGKNVFFTGEEVRFSAAFKGLNSKLKNPHFWFALDRDDGICCKNVIIPAPGKENEFNIVFPSMPLLPGGYKVSLGIRDGQDGMFQASFDNAFYFRMVFDKQDHGTVYLKHKWELHPAV